MIFEKLKLRDLAAAKRFDEVKAEHGLEAKRLRSFARAVDYILADQEFLRENFRFAVHDFIEYQRQHLQKEERLLFPAAIKALRSDDWAKIDARLDNRKDPLFNNVVEQRFQNLQWTILRWEQETEETRMAVTRI